MYHQWYITLYRKQEFGNLENIWLTRTDDLAKLLSMNEADLEKKTGVVTGKELTGGRKVRKRALAKVSDIIHHRCHHSNSS